MVLADSEHVETYLIGLLDLLDQVAQTLCSTERPAALGVCRREAIDADLYQSPFRSRR
jgi:hypothetical protein